MFPFPGLDVNPIPSPQLYSYQELRLIYHVASISHQLGALEANGFTLWTSKIPTIIGIGATHRFVMDALMAFSAEHISSITGCPMVGKMAFEHRGHALVGLGKAIHAFSQENSDAVLAASLVLSWQATDWRGWTHHMHGTRGIIESMEPWKDRSQFAEFMTETATFPTAPSSPKPDHKPRLPGKDDMDAFSRTLHQLQKLETHLKQNREDTKAVAQLISFLKGTRKVDPNLQVADQFERLKPLRDWLFWLPVMHLQQSHASPSALVTIAHYYAVALLMERMFPEIGAAYFGSLSIGPLEEISRRLVSINVACDPNAFPELPPLLQLMSYATDMVREFRTRMGWFSPAPSPFVREDFATPMTTAPLSDGLPYAENPIFSYSTENLSIKTEGGAQGIPVSPMAMPSPYSNQQYLNIPPPMNGCYSPVSSTCDASSVGDDFYEASPAVYSDNEDCGPYDMGFGSNLRLSVSSTGEDMRNNFDSYDMGFAATHSPLGGPYGVGFVIPVQPVWN